VTKYADHSSIQSPPARTLSRMKIGNLCAQGFAFFGGLILSIALFISLYSIIGRATGWWRPFLGDFELLSWSCACAVFCFLPWMHYQNAYIGAGFLQKIFTPLWPQWQKYRDIFCQVLLVLLSVLLTFQTARDGIHKWQTGQESMVLGWPLWPFYLLIVPSCALWAVLVLRDGIAHFSSGKFDHQQGGFFSQK